MSKIKTLNDVFITELKDLYSAEKQLLKALPKMQKKASSSKLKETLAAHLEETKIHEERLLEIESMMEVKLSGKTCKAMKGLIEEGKEVLEEDSENEALIDALLIGAARRVEHYEQAAYCTARAMAKALGETKAYELLAMTFDEEVLADKKLSDLLNKEVLSSCLEDESSENKAPKRKSSTLEKIKSLTAVYLLVGGLSLMLGMPSSSNAQNTNGTGTAPQFGTSTTTTNTDKGNVAVGTTNTINGNKDLSPNNKDMSPKNPQVDQQVHGSGILGKTEKDNLRVPTKLGNDEVSQIKGKLSDDRNSRLDVDNSGINQRDRSPNQPTADRQALMDDPESLAVVRRELVANSELSLNGQNVKIMTSNGVITLRGPVETDAEKDWIEATVIKVLPSYKVDNRIEVLAN